MNKIIFTLIFSFCVFPNLYSAQANPQEANFGNIEVSVKSDTSNGLLQRIHTAKMGDVIMTLTCTYDGGDIINTHSDCSVDDPNLEILLQDMIFRAEQKKLFELIASLNKEVLIDNMKKPYGFVFKDCVSKKEQPIIAKNENEEKERVIKSVTNNDSYTYGN